MSVARTEMAERQALGQTGALAEHPMSVLRAHPERDRERHWQCQRAPLAHQDILQNSYPPRDEAKPQSLASGTDTSWPQRFGGQKSNTLGIAKGGGGGSGISGAEMIKPPPTARCYLLV
eukprot:s2897_g6.t1